MSNYTIKELENISGIKSHTIRIWEKRYNLLTPIRTDTNIRKYGDSELKKLLNVTSLLGLGMKISKIAELSESEINSKLDLLLANVNISDETSNALVNKLISATIEYNEIAFDKVFSSGIIRFGLINTYIKIIYPLLEKVGILWSKSDLIPAQEHFLSNLIKQKLQTAIDSTVPCEGNDSPWILFLPEEEHHDIGLLFSSYILRQSGHRVIYLGARVPIEGLYSLLANYPKANLLFFLVKEFDTNQIKYLVQKINSEFSEAQVFVSLESSRAAISNFPKSIKTIHSVEDLLKKV